jgi:hypothetical protein
MVEWTFRYTYFLISAVVEDGWLTSRLGRLTPGETAPITIWIDGLVILRAGLDDVENRKTSPSNSDL